MLSDLLYFLQYLFLRNIKAGLRSKHRQKNRQIQRRGKMCYCNIILKMLKIDAFENRTESLICSVNRLRIIYVTPCSFFKACFEGFLNLQARYFVQYLHHYFCTHAGLGSPLMNK